MNLSDAKIVSGNIVSCLEKYCLPGYCKVAGSIRRESENPGDIDIVLIPTPDVPRPKFGDKQFHKTFLDRALWEMENGAGLTKLAGGDKLKRYTLDIGEFGINSMAIPVIAKMQITICTPDNWTYWYLIRTGPADFSHWIVTQKQRGGAIPNGVHYNDFHLWNDDGTKIETPDEHEWFKALGLLWISPKERRAPAGWRSQ